MDEQVALLFRELADLPPSEREKRFHDGHVPPEIRAEVESLLQFDEKTGGPFTGQVSYARREALEAGEPAHMETCGPYRLVQLLGSGGMGSVYLAERSDGEIQRSVAIKFLRATDRSSWQHRFLRERQLLATLSHPSIAHVLDAGRTDDGQPYLVMEYVDGVPIDVYAAGKDLRTQLELFLQVCDAVSYAHRHLIIHRDLKPSNILVDASGQPKLLDFGIAKVLDESADPTQTVERMLTPSYASPEQFRGAFQTTATDVYSLGAVLYKLLTGHSPHEPEEPGAHAVDVLTGKREIPAPERWNSSLPSDMDYILRKALRNEPQERYPSVDELARDIRALLDSRPVAARSGDAWYRTRKFLRRYWIPVTAAALVVASLTAGLYLVNRERAIAQRRFLGVRQLSNRLLDMDTLARDLPGTTKIRQLIVDSSLEYLSRLAPDVRGDPALALEFANAYMRVARVQGVTVGTNLGQMDQAEKSMRIAESFIDSVLAAQPANRTALLRAAQIAHDRMILARQNGHPEETLSLARKSAAALEKFHAGPADRQDSTAFLTVYMNVADELRRHGQFDEALRLCDQGLEVARLLRTTYPGNFLWVRAEILRYRGDLEPALQSIQESVDLLNPGAKTVSFGQTFNFVLALIYEGEILGDPRALSLGRPKDALVPLRRAFQISDDLAHKDAADQTTRGRMGMAAVVLGEILRDSDPRGALDLYDHALRHLIEIKNNRSLQHYQVNLLAGSSYALRRLGRQAEARQRLDEAFALLRQLKLYPAEKVEPGSELDNTLQALADNEADTGNAGRAIEIYERLNRSFQAAETQPQALLNDAAHIAHVWQSLAALYRRVGNRDRASALETESLRLWQQWDRKLPHNSFVLRQMSAFTN